MERKIDLVGRGAATIRRRSPVLIGAGVERIVAAAEELRAGFEAACTRAGLTGRLEGWPAAMAFRFEPWEGAEPEAILQAFLLELESRGVLAGPVLSLVAQPNEADVRAVLAAFHEAAEAVLARLRDPDRERDPGPYHSGGVPFVFPTSDERVSQRGLAVHRSPGHAPVDFHASAGALRIVCRAGPLPADVAAGFYAPTLLDGDFTAVLRYRIGIWNPGPQASVALLAHDPEAGTSALAELDAIALSAGDEGELKLVRKGRVLTSWHRRQGDWQALGEERAEGAPPVLVGAKLSCAHESGGLEVEALELRLEGEPAAVQPPLPPERADPRRSS